MRCYLHCLFAVLLGASSIKYASDVQNIIRANANGWSRNSNMKFFKVFFS